LYNKGSFFEVFGGIMNEFTMAATGGALIGLAASILLLTQGRIAGISGITGSLLKGGGQDKSWRWAFVFGLLTGGLVLALVSPQVFVVSKDRPLWMMGLAGLLVGFGTQMGSGCTSGHGVCGITRLSPRSLVATVVFMIAGMLIATLLAGEAL
jgi:uncharacterized membrane protein YedE/YeeE